MVKTMKGLLVEYSLAIPPLVLTFEFNPRSLSRSRSVRVNIGGPRGARGGYDFVSPAETPRASQGVSADPEVFSLEILLDATDRINDGDPVASRVGIEPELDTLRLMVEPKSQGPSGVQLLWSLGQGGRRAFQRDETASVHLFVWGTHIIPVFLTAVRVEEMAHLPALIPYRATVGLEMQVIEADNPFRRAERLRQAIGASLNLVDQASTTFGGLFR